MDLIRDKMMQLHAENMKAATALPYPVAVACSTLDKCILDFLDTGQRYLLLKCSIDTIEVYIKFITICFLSEARALAATVPDISDKVSRVVFGKRRDGDWMTYSIGDWIRLCQELGEIIQTEGGGVVFPEIVSLVIGANRKLNEPFSNCMNQVACIRNRRTGHAYLHDVEDEQFDSDLLQVVNTWLQLLKDALVTFKNSSLLISFYQSEGVGDYTWRIQGLDIKESIEKQEDKSFLPRVVRLVNGSRELHLCPFTNYMTGPMSIEYYYMMDSFHFRKSMLDEVEYLGIGFLKSKRKKLSLFHQSEQFARMFKDLFHVEESGALRMPCVDQVDSQIEAHMRDTVDRPDLRHQYSALLRNTRIMIIEASPGAGKTVFASWWADAEKALISYHSFEQNSDPLLKMYRDYISRWCVMTGAVAPICDDWSRIKEFFHLSLAQTPEAKRPLVLFDGLDEMPRELHRSFFECAEQIASFCRVVILTRPLGDIPMPDSCMKISLEGMSITETERIPAIKSLELARDAIQLIHGYARGNPLIAIIAAREYSRSGVLLSGDLKAYFAKFVRQLCGRHGKEDTEMALGLLMHATRPLRFEELHQILAGERLDRSHIRGLFESLRPFLVVDENGGCRFFHKSFPDSIQLSSQTISRCHLVLAQAFERMAGDDLAHVPHHLFQSGNHARFLAKAPGLPKEFTSYFISRAKLTRNQVAPEFTDPALAELFWALRKSGDTESLLIVAQVLYYFGFWREAEQLYTAEFKRREWPEARMLKFAVQLGALYKNLDKWNDARAILLQAITRVTGSVSPPDAFLDLEAYEAQFPTLCRLYHNLASIHYDSGDSRTHAVTLFELSRHMARRCGDELCEIATENGLLCAVLESGAIEEAERMVEDLKPRFDKHICEAMYFRLNSMAVYLRKGRFKDILRLFDLGSSHLADVEALLFTMQNRQLAAYFFNNFAVYHLLTGDKSAALRCVDHAIAISEKITDNCMLAGALINRFVMNRDPADAGRAEQIARQIGDDEQIAYLVHNRLVLQPDSAQAEWLVGFYKKIGDDEGPQVIGQLRPWIMTQFIDMFL